MNTDKNINIKEIAKTTDGFSGAEIEAVVREAGMDVLRENIVGNEKNLVITEKHIKKAIKEIKNIEKEKGKNKKNNLEKGVI
jgi:ATP-dependent 26S proteasome regulatory subunit